MVTTRSQSDKAEVDAAFQQAIDSKDTKSLKQKKSEVESLTDNVASLSLQQPCEGGLPAAATTTTEAEAASRPDSAEEESTFEPVSTIEEFCDLVESVPPDQWQKRTAALDSLVTTLATDGNGKQNHQQLSSMAPAVAQLLKDPRSTVVKLSCGSLQKLFHSQHKKTSAGACATATADLLVELFPTILDVAALTSAVIRKQVQDMVEFAIPICESPGIIPTTLERLQKHKSKTVREACVVYLRLAVQHWKSIDDDSLQSIGNSLITAMRDPAPSARDQAKKGLEVFRQNHTDAWSILVKNPPKGRDPKLQKLLVKSLDEPTVSLEKLSKQSSTSSSRPASRGGGPSKFSKFRAFQKQKEAASGVSSHSDEKKENGGFMVL